MTQSVEVRFAQSLNQIATGEDAGSDQAVNPLMAKLGAHIARQTTQKVDSQVKGLYKQIKALELQSKSVVSRKRKEEYQLDEGDTQED